MMTRIRSYLVTRSLLRPRSEVEKYDRLLYTNMRAIQLHRRANGTTRI